MPISPSPPRGTKRTGFSLLVVKLSGFRGLGHVRLGLASTFSTSLHTARAGVTASRVSQARSVTPEEAQALLTQGYVYVDVRSEPEFEAGHVPGAFNVPLNHRGPAGMVPNPDFLSVMQQAFGKGEKLVVGCKAGGRSQKAAAQLAGAGYTELVDMSAGWDGSRDAFGRLVPGWSAQGFPVEPGAPAGQRYEDVKQRAPKGG